MLLVNETREWFEGAAMKKGTSDKREQEYVLNMNVLFNSETTRTVRSSGDDGSQSWEEMNLMKAYRHIGLGSGLFRPKISVRAARILTFLTSALTSGWQTQLEGERTNAA